MWGSSLESHPLSQNWRVSLAFPGTLPFGYLAVNPRFWVGTYLNVTSHFFSAFHPLSRVGQGSLWGNSSLPALLSFTSAFCFYVASGSEVSLGLYVTLFKIHSGDNIFFYHFQGSLIL